MTTKYLAKRRQTIVASMQRFNADRMLKVWRARYAERLKGLDAVKAIRKLRERALR